MITIGDTFEVTEVVSTSNTANALGSGALEVFGTPFMVSMMENAGLRYMAQHLPEDKGSVGTEVHVFHTASTPVGMKVTVKVTVSAISENGKMVDFDMIATDEKGEIGHGHHQRAIITNQRFMEKTLAKLDK